MAHSHHDHSHEHVRRLSSLNRAFIAGILLNSVFVAAEFTAGILSNSMGLLSDAGHNLSDVASLLLALLAFRLAQVRPTSRYTYGYRRSTILVSLLNAVILLVAVGAIVVESVRKLLHPEPVGGEVVLWVAGIGVVVNFATALFFLRDKDRDLNVRGAYLHMAADALVSVGVMVSGAVMMATGWYLIDPLVGLLVAARHRLVDVGAAARQPAVVAGRRSRGDRLRRGLPHGGVAAGCERGAPSPRLGAQYDRERLDGARSGTRFAADAAIEGGAPRTAPRTGDRSRHARIRERRAALRRTCRLRYGTGPLRRRIAACPLNPVVAYELIDSLSAAADAAGRSRDRYRQRHRVFRAPHQRTFPLFFTGPFGRRDDLRLVRRTVRRVADVAHGPVGRHGRRLGDGRLLFRRHPADRRHRPAGALVRESARDALGRGDEPPPP